MNYTHLTKKERALLAQLLNYGISVTQIAQRLSRSKSTVSREIKRNSLNGRYAVAYAQAEYLTRRLNCHRVRRYEQKHLVDYVSEKLELTWSPEQIAGRIALEFPDDDMMRISHSSIYRWLYLGLVPRSLQLRMKLRHFGHTHNERRGVKVDARDIRERSRQVFRRKRFGDWEVDTIVSGKSRQSFLLNITERKSRYCCLTLLRNTKKETMMRAFTFFFGDGKLPLKTMTSDRGIEFNCHREFENTFQALYYFTRPAAPWQKPTVENTNGLIRQFFPKAIDLAELTDEAIQFVMNLLNNRPRKSLNWNSPAEVLATSCCT